MNIFSLYLAKMASDSTAQSDGAVEEVVTKLKLFRRQVSELFKSEESFKEIIISLQVKQIV